MRMSSESKYPSKTETDAGVRPDRNWSDNHMSSDPAGHAPADLRVATAEALASRERRLFKEVKKARSSPSEKTIHDLRVAMRRMIALLEVVTTVLPASGADGLRKQLKKHLAFLSDLRDTQVQILETEELIKEHGILRDFLFDLKARQAVQTKRACKEIDRIEIGTMKDYFGLLKPRLDTFLSEPTAREAAHATLLGTLGNIYLKSVPLRDEIRKDEADRTENIHHLRLMFKRFRYTTEILQPTHPGVTNRLLNKMSKYQGKMGAIQDTRVLASGIDAHEKRARKKERKRGVPLDDSYAPVKALLANRLKEQIESFLPNIDEFEEYWACIK